jgi:hypothetical protein
MRYFDQGNAISMDSCALVANDLENSSILEYNTYNFFYPDGDCRGVNKRLEDLSLDNPNLRFRNGYGNSAPCTIDEDSMMRFNSEVTHGREKRQFNARNFHANPNISKGSGPPQTESLLQQGIDTSVIRDCDRLTEHDFDRFVPFDKCMANFYGKYASSLPIDHTIGKNSRDIVRSREYLQKCGVNHSYS